ncbi:MAG: hypothetical protein JXC31_01585 [Acholeplasmataceae bacterium]|nr:hypothetical protein [Acholeplasmataceae bacterium]
MSRLTRESNVTFGTKEYKIDELLKTIIYLPSDQIKTFFIEIGLKIPRELRMFVLRETLRSKVIETRKSRLTLADELNYRLSWFTEFTETQLENLLIFFDDHTLERSYLEEFWTDLISYLVEKEVSTRHLKKLLDDSIAYVKKHGLEFPNMKTFNRDIKDLFFDSFGRIDGLAPAKFRPVLYKSSTLSEIRDLGSKYEVDVPRRLKKTELADIIIKELKDRGQHTEKLEGEIRSMSVIVMQRFAIDHDIKASTELKKEEIIEYILANAKETKETYFVPDSQDAYEKEIEEVAENLDELNEEPEEEPEKEEIVAIPEIESEIESAKDDEVESEIQEETAAEIEEKLEEEIEEEKEEPEEKKQSIVAQPQMQVAASSIDLSELVSEIKKLRETFEAALLTRKAEHDTEKEEQSNAISVSDPESKIPDHAPIILNSAEFYGNPKALKKIIKKDEADEREKFIEEKKAESSIGVGEHDDEDQIPGELRFFGKMFKAIGRGLLKLLKVLLKFTLIIAVIGVVLLILYAVLTYFVTTLTFLDGVNNFLNGIQISGVGLLDRLHAILASLGL